MMGRKKHRWRRKGEWERGQTRRIERTQGAKTWEIGGIRLNEEQDEMEDKNRDQEKRDDLRERI